MKVQPNFKRPPAPRVHVGRVKSFNESTVTVGYRLGYLWKKMVIPFLKGVTKPVFVINERVKIVPHATPMGTRWEIHKQNFASHTLALALRYDRKPIAERRVMLQEFGATEHQVRALEARAYEQLPMWFRKRIKRAIRYPRTFADGRVQKEFTAPAEQLKAKGASCSV